MEHLKGILGLAVTAIGTATAWANVVELGLRILAGAIACVAGVWTIRYYAQRSKESAARHVQEMKEAQEKHELEMARLQAQTCSDCRNGITPSVCPVTPRPASCRNTEIL